MTVLMLIFVIGLHWILLQSTAWLFMAIRYVQQAPLTEAIAMTFDGEHPCALCKMVADGRAKEKTPERQKASVEKDWLLMVMQPSLYPPCLIRKKEGGSLKVWLRFEQPPAPPPRLA